MAGFINKLTTKVMGDDSKREVPNKELLKFATGIIGQNHAYNLLSAWFYYFCVDVMYFDPLLIGTILAFSRIWDAINDPLAGTIIDRHIFKNGEKLRPYLKILAIPIGILVALLFIDIGLPQKQAMYYILVVYFLFDFLYSFQDIAQWGMTAMISTSSEERGRAAQIGRIGGTIGGWLPGLIVLVIANADLLGITEKQVFFVAGLVFGLGGMAMSLLTASAKERAPAAKVEGKVTQSFKLLFKNKIVMLIVLASILNVCTLTIQQIYFFKYMVNINFMGFHLNGLNASFIFGLLVGIPGMIALPFATKFARRVGGMKNVLYIATITNIVTRVAAYMVGYEGIRIVFTGILLAISGIPTSMMGIATTVLLGDSLDYMEWKTGQRNEGTVFSMQNFTAKITSGISTFFTGLTLSLLQFDATLYKQDLPQSPIFYKWVWPIFILAPALGSLLYLIPIMLIKYNDKQKVKLEARLSYARAVKRGEIATPVISNSLQNRILPLQVEKIYKRALYPSPKFRDDIEW